MKRMIDPPSGWLYGFPKEMPSFVIDTKAWLVANGYPKKEIDEHGEYFYVRIWMEDDNDK